MRCVAFDLDGVLVDSYHVWRHVLNATLEEFGGRPISEEEFRPHWGQGIEDDLRDFFPACAAERSGAAGRPGRTHREVEEAYGRLFPLHVAQVCVLPGAVETVRRLTEEGARLAVVTNSPRDVAEALLRQTGVQDAFETTITASDGVRPKPHPDMVLLAAERLGTAPQQLIFIGDSDFDRRAATAAGARFLLFRNFAEIAAQIWSEVE